MKRIFILVTIILTLNTLYSTDYYKEQISYYLSNKNLDKVEEYENDTLIMVYYYKIDNNSLVIEAEDKRQGSNKYVYQTVEYKNNKEIFTIYAIDGNKMFYSELLYTSDNKIHEVNTKYYYGSPAKSKTLFEYNKTGLIIKEVMDNVIKVFSYDKKNRISEVKYSYGNNSLKEKFEYTNDTDYICEPSLVDYNPDISGSVKYDKKIHIDKIENNVQYITDEYYLKKYIAKSIKRKIISSKIVEYIAFYKQFKQTKKYVFSYNKNAFAGNQYTPTVDNLRFRETEDTSSKILRKLKKGEKLELLEKGKTETIGDATGVWVKVRTEQGEIGWCFDAYLEEVKKKR